jgi:hypothetical protein
VKREQQQEQEKEGVQNLTPEITVHSLFDRTRSEDGEKVQQTASAAKCGRKHKFTFTWIENKYIFGVLRTQKKIELQSTAGACTCA